MAKESNRLALPRGQKTCYETLAQGDKEAQFSAARKRVLFPQVDPLDDQA